MKGFHWPMPNLALLFALILLVLTACDVEDKKMAQDFATDWAKNKGYDPNTLEGWARIAGDAIGGTGDPLTDAALGSATVMKPVEDADKLANDARDSLDPKKMDEAIKKSQGTKNPLDETTVTKNAIDKAEVAINMRPDDYTYRNTLGLAQMTGNSFSRAQETFKEADERAKKQGLRAQELNLRNRINGLLDIEPRTAVQKNNELWFRQLCADQKALKQLKPTTEVNPACH